MCQLRLTLEAPLSEDVIMHSAPFGVSLADQIAPDFSLRNLPLRYEYLFAQLDYSIGTIIIAQTFSEAKKKLAERLALVLETEERLGFAGVTRSGDRLLIAVTSKRMIEVRSDSREVINILRNNLEVTAFSLNEV